MPSPPSISLGDTADAIPTKQFFVSMLTRDISLDDAILDLIDNCLDGALRMSKGAEVDYSKHWVKIRLKKDAFIIEDNCGGIPRNVAKNYAFKMGRDQDDNRDSDDETIGMYGVGMKRAIFKMGRESIVKTRCNGDSFEVPISGAWLDSKEWNPLPIVDTPESSMLNEPGTTIVVSELTPSSIRLFTNDSFINDLNAAIAEHFTMFLQRGLTVTLNGVTINPIRVEVLVTDGEGGPSPYVYQSEIDGVTVSITVGLNSPNGFSSDDDDSPIFERDRSAATSGWTIFCNDRAVIVGDKSRLTGWGLILPRYHPQYSIISGIIEFRSKNAANLPVTTTKRALDVSSSVWLQSLNKMRDGMRIWIDYTNAWKNHPRSDQTVHWKDAKPASLREVVMRASKRESAVKGDVIEFNPKKYDAVPAPKTLGPTSRKIVFSRPIEEIRLISKALFDTEDQKPSEVGETCFEMILRDINGEGGKE